MKKKIILNSRTAELKAYFNSNYQYIAHEMSDEDISKLLDDYPNHSIEQVADAMSDHILSKGLEIEIQL